MTDLKQAARERLDTVHNKLLTLSHRIHDNPELKFEEVQASGWLADLLSAEGFAAEKPYCELPTAFEATAGSGALRIAICAEYDALPGVGHACGHNIIATAAAGAGIAAAAIADEIGATVSVVGTPAEEGGGGKIVILERGGFDQFHAAMMVHPAPMDVANMPYLAAQRLEVRYTGKASHASSFPEKGINAADAITVAQVSIGLLRQHLRATDRVHGIVIKGGDAPNVVPSDTSAIYSVRARTIDHLEDVRSKVYRCFEAGALATGCQLEVIEGERAYAEVRNDPDMLASYKANAEALGRTFMEIEPSRLERTAGSTDMGNVSLKIPSIHPSIGINSWPAVNHQLEFAAHGVTPDGDRAVYDGALAMAWTIIDIATDEAVRSRLLASG
jgi:amidohydrolase